MGNIKKSFIVSSAVALVIALLIVIVFNVSFKRNPAKNYEKAKSYIDTGCFLEAAELLYNIDYKDSNMLLKNICDYNPQFYLYGLTTGNVTTLGNYKSEPITWNVIATKGGKLLLQTSYVIDKKIYNEYQQLTNSDDADDYKWNETSLCQWLNNDFLNEAFTETEKNAICQKGPQKTSVFILSENEIDKYEVAEYGAAEPTGYAVSVGAVKEADGRTGIMLRGKESPFISSFRFDILEYNTDDSDTPRWLHSNGDATAVAYGIRPCIWIKPTVLQTEVTQ